MRGRLFHGILAFGLLAIPATAQEILKSFDFYSAEDCGRNATEDSTTIDIFRIDIKDGDKDFISNCANTYIGLPNWPMENGQYKVFVDTSPIDEKCQLIFFTGPPSDDDVNTNTCFQFYRAINDNSGCARLTIPEHFGYAYCCGDGCSSRLGQDKRAEKPMVTRDVTQVKRAAPMERRVEARDDCAFTKTDSKIKTLYGPQEKASAQMDCPPDSEFGCPLTGDASAGVTIGTSTSLSVSTGFTGGFLGIGASVGIDTTTSQEWSSSTTFGRSYSLSVAAGTKAYLTFMPRYKCAKGKFDGSSCDKALQIGEQDWCIPALIKGNATDTAPIPDGIFSVVEIN